MEWQYIQLLMPSTYETSGLDPYINHDMGADVKLFVPNRNHCAAEIARTIVIKAYKSQVGSVSDFVVYSYDGSFYIRDIYDNASKCDFSTFIQYESKFYSMDYEIQK